MALFKLLIISDVLFASPPEAEVRGSNPLGRAIFFKRHERFPSSLKHVKVITTHRKVVILKFNTSLLSVPTCH